MTKIYAGSLLTALGFLSAPAWAQDTYVPLQSEEAHLFQRIEALSQRLSTSDLGSQLPIGRKTLATYLNNTKKDAMQGGQVSFSKVDQMMIDRAIGINGEWIEDASGIDGAQRSKKPILRYFYTTKENFFHYDNENFFVAANPVLYTQVGMGLKNSDPNTYINFRGAELRGRISNRIGFYTLLGDNQEKPFHNIHQWEQKYKSFPGYDYYRLLDNGTFDAFVGRGYFTVDVVPGYTQLAFGYDKQFIGNGIRSIIQSNESAASTFLRLKTNVGSFQIDNLFQELVADHPGLGNDNRLPRKYYSFHQVSKNFGNKLNIALFENTVFGASNNSKVTNLLPSLIADKVFNANKGDVKSSFGLQFKYLPVRSLQVYGQAMADNISLTKSNTSFPSSTYAAQLGLKYFNAFTLSNLDIQVELNHITPFMYQSNDQSKNQTHYNQALAHNMGAGFTEVLGRLKYQPHSKLYIDLTGSYFNGINSQVPYNNGVNIHMYYQQYNSAGIAPDPARNKAAYVNGNIAFELFTNFFIEAGGTYIKGIATNGGYAYGGLRWNISRKQFIYYQ